MPVKYTVASLGELEALVLLAVLRVGEDAYAVPVSEELDRHAGRRLTLGTIYKTLMRLEAKGLLTAHVGEPTPQRGGRRRKCYRVTADGRRAAQHMLAALERMARGLDLAWGRG